MKSMKKYFLTLALMLPMVAMAQHWTTSTNQSYPKEQGVIAQVFINGVEANGNSGLELAAFIGDECRADATVPMAASGTTTYVERYYLRVAGNLETEKDATIKFRAFYQNVEYEFTKTIAFTGEDTYGTASEPLVLNLDVVTGVTLPKTINISQPASAFPYTEDLTSQITYTYNTADGAPYTPKGESKLLSVPVYSWNVGNYADQLSFDGNKLTVGPAVEASYDIGLTVSIGESSPAAGPTSFRASTVIVVQIAKVPVTGITCSVEAVEINAWEDNFEAYMRDKVTVLPADASDKSYRLVGGDYLREGVFTKGGQYIVSIVPNDEDYEGENPTVTVTVYEKPTGISSRVQNGIEIGLGENVFDYLASTTTYSWMNQAPADEYAKKELTYKPGAEGYISEAGVATKVGQVSVTVSLKDGITQSEAGGQASYPILVNIISRLDRQVQLSDQTTFVKGIVSKQSPALVYVKNPGNEPFDPNDLAIEFENRFMEEGIPYAEQNQVVQMGTDEETGAKIYGFYILPKFVSERANYIVTYQGSGIEKDAEGNDIYHSITITQEQQLAEGWNWISVNALTSPDGNDVNAVFTQADIVEMRSQSQILYNDPTYGYFGDLTRLNGIDAMYKVKTNKATTAQWGATNAFLCKQSFAQISKGYNWINNPYEFDIPASRIDEFFGANFTPTDGDMIITLEGSFAQYSDGAWVASDNFALKEGKGLIYFSNAETAEQMTIDFNRNLAPQAEAAPVKGVRDLEDNMAADLFQYNPHAFADNMAMVATIEGLENPENYTLGVFVNDECRGRGQVVKDGKMFVSAVGKVGERLTFKLANNRTGEVTDLEDTMTYSLIKGSLKAPVQLSGTTVTGIAKTMDEAQDEAIYDMSGRRVEKMQKGIYIVGGKKVLKK